MRIHLRKLTSKLSGDSTTKGMKKKSSLYLAYQAPRQKTRYEWLKLYVFENPKTNLEKEHNKETMQLAESIRAKRMLDFQTTGNGFTSSEKGKISFLDYFKQLAEKKAEISNGNGGNWKSTYEHSIRVLFVKGVTVVKCGKNGIEFTKLPPPESIRPRIEGALAGKKGRFIIKYEIANILNEPFENVTIEPYMALFGEYR